MDENKSWGGRRPGAGRKVETLKISLHNSIRVKLDDLQKVTGMGSYEAVIQQAIYEMHVRRVEGYQGQPAIPPGMETKDNDRQND